MHFFKHEQIIRRYKEPISVRGYISIPYEDITLLVDAQTTEDTVLTTEDGSKAIQKLKVFCDEKLLVENQVSQQKADRIWFNDKWFECMSCRLSQNTPLKHYTATFTECLDQEDGPSLDSEEAESTTDETITDTDTSESPIPQIDSELVDTSDDTESNLDEGETSTDEEVTEDETVRS